MGFFRLLFYTTLVPAHIRDAIKVDELKKLNETKKKKK